MTEYNVYYLPIAPGDVEIEFSNKSFAAANKIYKMIINASNFE